jgi:copper amine oxidase-like protein
MTAKRSDVKKIFNAKSLICGLLIGTIVTIGITNVFASAEIKSAKYEEVKVSFNNSNIPLKNPLVSVVNNGENDTKMYMPAREILEYLGYNVDWNSSERSINISSKISTKATNSINNNITATVLPENTANKNIITNQANKLALEIINNTANWSYVEPLFPYMTTEGVKDMVDLYNQKSGNYKQEEEVLQYINKNNSTSDGSNQLKTKSDYDNLANEALLKTNDMFSILVYLPYMNTDKIDTMVKDYIEKNDYFYCIYNIYQYMSTKAIDDTVKSYIDKTDDYGAVTSILQFMSTDASDYVAKKYVTESKDQQYRQLFMPYLKH